MKFVKRISSIFVVLLLCSCTVVEHKFTIEQESLLTPCSDDVLLPNGLDGASMLQYGFDMQTQYNTCATRHDALIEAVRSQI